MATAAYIIAATAIAFGEATQNNKKEDAPNAAVHYRRAIAALPKLDEDDRPLLDDYTTDPLSDEARTLLKRAAEALREAKAGARIKRCDWGEWSEKELNFTQDRLMPTSQVGRLICLNARAAFAHGQVKEATEELAVALKLAIDGGRQGPWIAKLVQLSIEKRVIDILELQLPDLDKEGLKAVEVWLRTLPDRGRLDEATKGEKAFMQHALGNVRKQTDEQGFDDLKKYAADATAEKEAEATWKAAGRSAAGLVKLYELSVELLSEMDKILPLSSDKVASAFEEFRKRHKELNPPACSVSQVLERLRWADDRIRCRLLMIQVATAIRLRGPEALGGLKDPYGRLVIYAPKNGGFELRTETNRDGEPLAVVTVGGSE